MGAGFALHYSILDGLGISSLGGQFRWASIIASLRGLCKSM